MDTTKIFMHQIAVPGQPGNITEAEAATIRADQATILARPVIDQLSDVPDVTDTPVDGETLIWDAATSTWVSGQSGGSVDQIVVSGQPATAQDAVRQIVLHYGLTTSSAGPNSAYIMPVYSGTGSSMTVARGDHTHPFAGGAVLPFAASGSLSSGTRTLVSGTVSGLDSTKSYQIWAILRIDLRGEGTGAGRAHPSVSLYGSARTRFGGVAGYVRSVAGVDREATMEHSGIIVTGVTSITVSASIAHVDGDPKYIGGGELIVHVAADR